MSAAEHKAKAHDSRRHFDISRKELQALSERIRLLTAKQAAPHSNQKPFAARPRSIA